MIDLDNIDPALTERLRDALTARAALADGIVVPDPAQLRCHALRPVHRHRRRNTLLAVAAAALLIAGTTALIRRPSTHDVNVVPATTAPDPYVIPDTGFAPDPWPSETGGPTSWGYHFTGNESDLGLASFTLSHAGRPAVFVQILNDGSLPDDAEGANIEEVHVDGQPGVAWQIGGHGVLVVAPRPGRSIALTGNVKRAELTALVAAINIENLTVDADALPKSWTLADDPQGLAAIGGGDTARNATVGTIGVSWTAGSGPEASFYTSWTETPDPAAAMDLIDSVWGSTPVKLTGGRKALRIDGAATGARDQLVWAVDRIHLAWMEYTNIDPAEAVAIASSTRQTTKAEWASLRPDSLYEGGAESAPDSDGFNVIFGDGASLGSGDVFITAAVATPVRYRWKLVQTTNVPTNVAVGAVGYRVLILDDAGVEHSSASIYQSAGQPLEKFTWRNADVAGAALVLPSSVTNPGLSFNGVRRDIIAVTVDDNTQVVFTVGPAIDMPSDARAWVVTSGGTPLKR